MRQLARTDPQWQTKPPDQRVSEAADMAMQDMAAEAARKVENAQRQMLKTTETEARITRGMDLMKEGRSKALIGDMDQTGHYINGIKQESMGRLMALMDAVKSGEGAGAGRRIAQFLFDADNPQMSRDLAAEIFRGADGSTGNKVATEGAKAWLEVIETQRQRFNNAGGDVGKLDYGYLPQPHDAARIRAAGRDAWVGKMLPLLDRSRYVLEDGARMGDAEVTGLLGRAWETLATEGLNKQTPGQFTGSGAKANAGSEARQLHFKDGEAYQAYLSEFGAGSMYDAMLGHIGRLSRDIGLVERYGPNPNQQMRLQIDLAKMADGELKRDFGLMPQSYWDQLSGVAGTAQSARLAQIGTDVRNMQTFGKLGGAVISSITDLATFVVTTGYNRLSYWDAFKNYAKSAASRETKDFMTSHGIIADSMIGDMHRWTGDNIRQNWSGRLANSTMKLSLMNAWTDTLRRAFSLTMMQGLARLSKTEWGKLSEWDRTHMERKGLTADDWEVITKAQLTDFQGAQHLTPEAIRAVDVQNVRPVDFAAITDRIKAQTAELSARNVQDTEWISGRIDKFDQARNALNRRVREFADRRTARDDAAADALRERIELLDAQREQAALEVKIEADYNKLFTKADVDAYLGDLKDAARDFTSAAKQATTAAERAGQKFGERKARLDATARSASGSEAGLNKAVNAEFAKDRAALERDIEIAFKATPEAERAVFRESLDASEALASISQGMNSAGSIGRRYGAQREALTRRIADLEKRIGKQERDTKGEVNAAAKEAEARAKEMAADTKAFIERTRDRQARRQAVIDRLQRDEGDALLAEAERIKNEVVAKVLGLIQDESEYAVINPDLATKTLASGGGTQRGTVRGELARSVMQFKSFPIAMISRHWRRMMDAPKVSDDSAPVLGNRVAYSVALMLTTTALGAIALQAKQIVQGKDPIDMTGDHAGKFWGKAVVQGGGLSIAGDFLFNDPSDSYGGMASNMAKTALGPAFGTLAEASALGVENAWKAAKGKETHMAAQAVRIARANTPYLNLWYARAAVDHAGMHALQEALSPGYLSKMRQRAKKDFGQDYWWKPGTGGPDRAPDMAKAVGQ